jgi:hypothetical protein
MGADEIKRRRRRLGVEEKVCVEIEHGGAGESEREEERVDEDTRGGDTRRLRDRTSEDEADVSGANERFRSG